MLPGYLGLNRNACFQFHKQRLIGQLLAFLMASAGMILEVSVTAANHQPQALIGILENDLLYNPAPGRHHDRHYTQGLKLMFLDHEEPAPRWAQTLRLDTVASKLPPLGLELRTQYYGALFGQSIFTPEDEHALAVVSEDRPYAGWLYGGLAVQRYGATVVHQIPAMDSLELNIGIIGPEALGEWAQNSVHEFREFPTFDGWDNQLKTEPAFVLKYGRAWRWSFDEQTSRYFDAIPHAGFHLGTVFTSADFGLTFRLGWNLPKDFGVQTIDSPVMAALSETSAPFSIYAFGRVETRAVARNVFLDGNLYQHSHRVDKRPIVADLSYGIAVAVGQHLEFSWNLITRTREFERQENYDQFGSITAKVKWDY